MRTALQSAREWQGDLTHRRKDGSTVVVDSRHVLVERDGPPGAILEINRDISDRKRAEEQRAEVMARLAVLLEISESLSAAATPDEIVEILLEKAVPALGAYAGSVAVLTHDGTEVEMLGARGYPAALRAAFARIAAGGVDAAERRDSQRHQRGRLLARRMAVPLSPRSCAGPRRHAEPRARGHSPPRQPHRRRHRPQLSATRGS